jgi:hypothetical protein
MAGREKPSDGAPYSHSNRPTVLNIRYGGCLDRSTTISPWQTSPLRLVERTRSGTRLDASSGTLGHDLGHNSTAASWQSARAPVLAGI